MKRPPLSVVVPTFQGAALLRRCLPSVARDLGPEDELIVVDDGSRDESDRAVAESAPPARLLSLPRNSGFGSAANAGVRAAHHAIVVLLNNDVRVELGALDALATPFATQPDLFAVAARAEMPDGRLYQARSAPTWRGGILGHTAPIDGPPGPTLWAAGGMGAFDRARMLAMGGFDPIFAPFYWEDVDLCYRAWKRGWQVHYTPAARLIHDHQGTIGRLFRQRTVRLVQERNRLLLMWLNLTDGPLWRDHRRGLPRHLLGTGRARLFATAFALALARLPAVARRRRAEPRPVRGDREVFALLAGAAPCA